jgi:hypothetical protein
MNTRTFLRKQGCGRAANTLRSTGYNCRLAAELADHPQYNASKERSTITPLSKMRFGSGDAHRQCFVK